MWVYVSFVLNYYEEGNLRKQLKAWTHNKDTY